MNSPALLWNRLSYTGTEGIQNPDLHKKVVLSNQLAVLSGLPIVAYILLAPEKLIYVAIMLLAACISFSAVPLNHLGHHRLSRLMVIFAPQIGTLAGVYMLFALSEKSEYYAKFTLTATFILPMVLISIREKWLMILGVGLVIANFFGSEWVGQHIFYPIYQSAAMPPDILYLITPAVNFTLFFLGFSYLQRINLASEEHVICLLQEAQATNEELAQTTAILNQKQHRLDLINRRLARIVRAKSKDLMLRNEQLKDYAAFHAHQVRAPLARIMGLVIVLQQTDRDNPREVEYCLNRIEEAAVELDVIMKAFNNRMENEETVRLPINRELMNELAEINQRITETNELLYLEILRLQQEVQRLRESGH